MGNPDRIKVASYFGKPIGTGVCNRELQGSLGAVEVRTTYFNTMTKPVVICERNGFRYEIASAPILSRAKEFIVRIEYTLHAKALHSVRSHLATLEEEHSKTLEILRSAFEKTDQERRMSGRTVLSLDFPISEAELDRQGGTVYFADVDLLLTFNNTREALPHPYSEQAALFREKLTTAYESEGGFCFRVKMVDNERKFGPRWMNLGGSLEKIIPETDEAVKSGLYVTRVRDTGAGRPDPETSWFDLGDDEALEGLGIYLNPDQANAMGDYAGHSKVEALRLEKEITTMRKEADVQKLKMEREIAERDAQLRAAKEEYESNLLEAQRIRAEREHASEMEKLEAREYYEARSYQRKDSTELLKYIPTLLLGIGAMAMTLKGFFNK